MSFFIPVVNTVTQSRRLVRGNLFGFVCGLPPFVDATIRSCFLSLCKIKKHSQLNQSAGIVSDLRKCVAAFPSFARVSVWAACRLERVQKHIEVAKSSVTKYLTHL